MELAAPYDSLGKAFHWIPVRATKTMASRMRRLERGFRPPPLLRRYFFLELRWRSGNKGSTKVQKSSEISQERNLRRFSMKKKINYYLRISSKSIICPIFFFNSFSLNSFLLILLSSDKNLLTSDGIIS